MTKTPPVNLNRKRKEICTLLNTNSQLCAAECGGERYEYE